jgi:hypothetical protein
MSQHTLLNKLPISEDILAEIRLRLWDNRSWGDDDKEKRIRYLGLGFEMSARVSDYTGAEPGGSNHCIRLNDLTFTIETQLDTQTLSGDRMAATGAVNSAAGLKQTTAQHELEGEGPLRKRSSLRT